MFTGLIEKKGKVVAKTSKGISVDAGTASGAAGFDVKVGDSVSINGACLTVSKINKNIMSFDVSGESMKVTNLDTIRINDEVNLERPMKVDGRFHGHIVNGHVDATGKVSRIVNNSNSTDMIIELKDREMMRYVVTKGSIAINGVSLTVNEVMRGNSFRLTLIPHTLSMTNLLDLRPADSVNIEFDVLAKYVENMVKEGRPITQERLQELGYK